VVAALLRALNREIGDADVNRAAVAAVRRLGERPFRTSKVSRDWLEISRILSQAAADMT
jgi:hypothetical protein